MESLRLLRKGIASQLQHLGPDGLDIDSIAKDLYARHRIIGVGEATHGTSEIFTMRAAILKSLATQGLRALVIELNMASAEYLDDYVGGRVKGNPSMIEVMQNGRVYGIWQTPEVAETLVWIREFNAKHHDDPIRIYGIDGQAASAKRLLDLLEAKSPGFDVTTARSRDKAFGSGMMDFEYSLMGGAVKAPGPEMDKLFADRQQFVAELRTAVAEIPLSARERKIAELELRGLEQDCALGRDEGLAAARLVHTTTEYLSFIGSDTVRDKYMAENFTFIEKNLIGPEAHIMIWAHSGHLSRRSLIELDINCAHLPLGSYLGRWYGDQYHALNITVGSGTVRAFDSFTITPESAPKEVPFTVRQDSIERLIFDGRPMGTVFFKTAVLPLRDLQIDYLAIGPILELKERSGLARGTVADFDSFVFIPTGKASSRLKP